MTYYVYHLIDPRDGKPFYVGKGKGNRIEAHERQARLAGGRTVTSDKCRRIRAIWAADLAVIRSTVRYFADEQAALDFEFRQIRSLSGLTNVHLYPGARSRARKSRREPVPPQRACGPLKFTEGLIARIAWIVKMSNGLKNEFTTDLVGASPLYKTIEEIFNKRGYVKFARHVLSAWAKQRGAAAVRERFRPYGIELAFSENTENC